MIHRVDADPLVVEVATAGVARAADRADLDGMARAVAPVISPPLIDSSCAHR
jgi:hypothetical protein